MDIDFKRLILMIVDQSLWRSMEWGGDLIQGQFEEQNVAFTKDSVQALINFLNTQEGKDVVHEVMSSDHMYWGNFSSVTDAVETYLYNEEGCEGILSTRSLTEEKARAPY